MNDSVASKKDKLGAKFGSISSLLSNVNSSKGVGPGAGGGLTEVEVGKLKSGKYQPRKEFNQEALEDLAESIKAQGVMQPIVVRPIGDGIFEIIAGERRWRASQLAGLKTIPVIERDIDDQTAIAMALIENIQREDLSPLEEAQALQRLKDEFGLNGKAVAQAVGKREKEVSELLGLLKLPEFLKKLMGRGTGSPQILAVLNRCYKLDADGTESFVSNKNSITYDEANAFQKFLKDNNGEGESTEGVDGEEEAGVKADTKNSKKDKVDTGAKDDPSELNLGGESDDGGFIVDNKNFIVAVEYSSTEWMLDLTRKDNDADYCWIKRGSDTERVLARELTVIAVQ